MKHTKSYPAYVIERSCLRKKGHTLKQADDFVTRRLFQTGEVLLYYKCDFCGQYHLTKNKELKPTEEFLEIV